jgi:Fe-S cluster assembly protein SufB
VRKGGKDTILGREITRRDQYIIYYSPDKHMSGVRKTEDYFLVPIKKIDHIPYEGPVYNFELTAAPNAYVVKGFAVHNCTAPTYSSDSLHSAVVEIVVKANARARYTTIQNWSTNVFNLVTKRSIVYNNGVMEWVDCNIGSLLTMKYPAVYLMEPGAHGEVLSVAFAGKGQVQDAGGKIVHGAPNTSSQIISKSISMHGGRATYRGLLKVYEGATGAKSNVVCDALLMDEQSRTDTYPSIEIDEKDVTIGHEASVSKVNEDQLFYLMSRGIGEDQANAMIVSGFIEPIAKELPAEYSIELYRLVQLQMEGSVG